MSRLANEYLAWERTCLEQAELCRQPDARAAYLSLASKYHTEAEALGPKLLDTRHHQTDRLVAGRAS
jgi:hypothetical protein